MQNSAVLRAARQLDFEKDAFGGLGQLMCGRRDASGSDNASVGVPSAGLTGNGPIVASNSSGRGHKCWQMFTCIIWIHRLFFFFPNFK